MLLQNVDREALRTQFKSASPFPFFKIDNLLDRKFAEDVAGAYPSFEEALTKGRTFKAVNERKKVQITDATRFPSPIARLNAELAAPQFLADLSYITGIDKLLADDQLIGGGMHMTGPGGRLDVHVDFNLIEDRQLHRRLNLLLYLNPTWKEEWGGHIQLWDRGVKNCEHEFAPAFNRCVVFETNEISFHGVVPVQPAAPMPRISFATYYYTKEAPAHWDGQSHSTIFKARPDEKLRRFVSMPAEKAYWVARSGADRVVRGIKKLTGA